MGIPLYYYGNVAFWTRVCQYEEVLISKQCVLPKKSYYNRTVISTSNGLQNLSIPLIGGRGQKATLEHIEISYVENWVSKHKMALLSAYSKSPYYEYYISYFEDAIDKKHTRLFDLNMELFRHILRILKLEIDVQIINTEANTIIQDIPNQFHHDLAPYPQVFRYKYPFYPDLSILDLIFNLGSRSKVYLLEQQNKPLI